LVIEHPSPDEERPALEVMVQRCGELAAFVRRKLRRADTIWFAVENARGPGPAVGFPEADGWIDTPQTPRARGEADRPGRLLGTAFEDEVSGRAHLARSEQGTGSALHDLDSVDGVIETEERARVHEGEGGHAIERHAFDHVGEEGRVAAAREAGDLDV